MTMHARPLAAACAALLLAGLPGAGARASEAGEPRRLSFDYEVYVGGINAIRLGFDAVLERARYDMGMRLATQGVAGWMFDWKMTAESRGEVRDGRVKPTLARGDSIWRGKSRKLHLEYGPDGAVRARTDPPFDPAQREPVPPALRAGTRDLPGALFSALRAIGRAGRCDHIEKVFDARRRYDLVLEHVGTDTLAPSDYSPYGGPAIVCRLRVEMIAGRRLDNDPDRRRAAARYATVWLARVFEDAPPLPVRFQYELTLGSMTAYLKSATLDDAAGKPRSLAARP
jgi:hypothetical protein